MKRTTLLALVLTVSGSLATAQNNGGTIRGTVLLEGSKDPIPFAQIAVNLAPTQKLLDAVSSSLASQGIPPAQAQVLAERLLTIPAAALQQNIDQLKTQNESPDSKAAIAMQLEAQQLRAGRPDFPLRMIADGQGRFVFPNVPPGSYSVVIQREGFFGKPADEKASPPDNLIIPVSIPPQGDAPSIEASLLAGAIVQGVVRGTDGNPVSRASVQAFPSGSPVNTPQNAPINLNLPPAVKTDELGAYRLFWLRPGIYNISATPPMAPASIDVPGAAQSPSYVRTFFPDVSEQAAAVPISLKSGDEFYRMDITLRAGSGGASTLGPTPGTTNGQSYKIHGQVSNTVMLLANSAGVVAPTTATLLLAPRNPNGPGTGVRTVGAVAINSMPQSVAFDIAGIVPGNYDLFARMPDSVASAGRGPGRGLFAWGRVPVEITTTDVNDVILTIHSPVAVNGKLTIDGMPPTGRDKDLLVDFEIAGVAVAFPNYQGANFGPQAAQTNGEFTMPGVAEGTYSVSVIGMNEDSYIADVRSGGSSVFDSGFTVGKTTPEAVEVQLATNGGTVEGILTSGSENKPLPFTRVTLVPPAEHRGNNALFRTAITDGQGHFMLRGIRPDNYTLFAWESPGTRPSVNDGFLAKYEPKATTLRVQPSMTTRVNVSAIPAD